MAILLATSAISYAQDAANLPAAPTPSASVLRLPYGAGSGDQVATAGPLPLSLDDAIARGFQRNLQVALAKQNELGVHGGILSAGNALLPNLNAVAKTQTQQVNLAAMGFKPSSLAGLGFTGTFPTIVKVDTTTLEMTMDQALFNVPAYYLFRAAQ